MCEGKRLKPGNVWHNYFFEKIKNDILKHCVLGRTYNGYFFIYFNLNAKTNKNSQCTFILYTDPFLYAFAKLRRATIIFVLCPSIHMEQLRSHWTDFHIIWHLNIFDNMWRKFKFYQNLTRIRGSLLEDKGTYLSISRSFLLRMRNFSYKSCRENQNRHFMFNNIFFFENRAFYEVM